MLKFSVLTAIFDAGTCLRTFLVRLNEEVCLADCSTTIRASSLTVVSESMVSRHQLHKQASYAALFSLGPNILNRRSIGVEYLPETNPIGDTIKYRRHGYTSSPKGFEAVPVYISRRRSKYPRSYCAHRTTRLALYAYARVEFEARIAPAAEIYLADALKVASGPQRPSRRRCRRTRLAGASSASLSHDGRRQRRPACP